ncbi:MAG: PqiC family protein [Pseudomonadota bacterium]
MRLSILRIQLVLILALTGSLLSGCIKIATNPVTSTRFYVLTPVDSTPSPVGQSDQNRPLSLEIAALRLPQYLEKPQIITRSGTNQLELAEYHQWGGNLRKNMIQVLARNLSQLLVTPDISIAPFRPSVPPDFSIEVDVMQFEAEADGQVRLITQWRILRGMDQKNLIVRMTNLVRPVDASNFEQTVLAMSALLGELSRMIAQEILTHVSKDSAS